MDCKRGLKDYRLLILKRQTDILEIYKLNFLESKLHLLPQKRPYSHLDGPVCVWREHLKILSEQF